MSFLEALIDYIETQGIATFEVDMFANEFPSSSPDSCICIVDNGGHAPNKMAGLQFPAIQVLSRDRNYRQAHEKIMEVYDLFHADSDTEGFTAGPYLVLFSKIVSEPIPIGRDENNRERISLNLFFKVTKT